ncbi:hypothetical protein CLV59_102225 [Chitinophaga dinghuensis]|uniref:Solute:sodium symporter small subunit n=1 Tax=Chitinophaga dinghuensis TaxID=1539050 RepID=A0A327W6F3_9BACT|nr:hypothetical protein [Chitinophaga dinghuensis]RAJ85521.1 hypothetical protein CLV59_102225 [Chitinophaga dinghuensis]
MTDDEKQEQPTQQPGEPGPGNGTDPDKPPFDMDLLRYFFKIMRTVVFGFFWMMINVFLGLYLGFGVPEESTPGRLLFFYSWLTISMTAFIYFLWRMWRKKEKEP